MSIIGGYLEQISILNDTNISNVNVINSISEQINAIETLEYFEKNNNLTQNDLSELVRKWIIFT